jgi:hypothetical protein
LVRDQEVGGSNPLAPTIISRYFMKVAAFSCELRISVFPLDCTLEMRQLGWAHFAGMTQPLFRDRF